MISYDAALAAILNTAADKTDWCNKLFTALGATRTLVCKRHTANTDVFLNGVTFYDADLTGNMAISAGNLVTFGAASNARTHTAADLSTGFAVIRIIGNGHYVEGTLGLTGAATDFTVRANPTANSGLGFASGCAILAPRFMNSGAGPAVPPPISDTPYTVTIEDWSSGSAVVAGSASFDTRVDNLVFEDADLAAEIGDVAVYQSSQVIVHGNFEFGIMLMRSTPSNGDGGVYPLEQVLICSKPLASTGWTTYPAMDTYVRSTHNTHPPAFKVRIKRSDGAVIGTIEMHDGLPINDPSLAQNFYSSTPLRPHYNCGMLLPWQSTPPKKSSRGGKFFNGIEPESRRPSMARQQTSFLANLPMASDGYNSTNSLNQWFALQKWPYIKAYQVRPAAQDPYLFDPNGGTQPGQSYATGWGYEPGSVSGHDWFSGPGGPRSDRSTVPTVLALFASDPNYVRPEGAIPIKQLVDAWGLAYCNHSCHWVRDVKTFAGIPKQESLEGQWSFANAYYGGGPYSQGPSKCIDLAGVSASSSTTAAKNYDSTGRFVWASWSENSLHSYSNPGWYTILLNSPMHAVLDRFKFDAQWMSCLSTAAPTSWYPFYFLMREQAWRWLHYIMTWKVSSRSSLTYSRAQVEARFKLEIEQMYNDIYKPTFVDNSQDPYFLSIKNLGTPGDTDNYGGHSLVAKGGNLGYYLAHTLQLMKTTGLWDVMRAKSTKCQLALDMMIYCLDLFSIDWILDTDGYTWLSYEIISQWYATPPTAFTASDVPSSWAAWRTSHPKTAPVQDFIHDSTGAIFGMYEWDVAMHMKAQWPSVHKQWFSEYPNARMDAAIAKYKGYYDQIAARVNAASTPYDKRMVDFTYLYPPLGLLSPTL